MRESHGRIKYEINAANNYIKPLTYQDSDFIQFLHYQLLQSRIIVDDPFDRSSKNIIFTSTTAEFCNDVFDAIKTIKSKYADIIGLATLADSLFEAFTPYWRIYILGEGRDVI